MNRGTMMWKKWICARGDFFLSLDVQAVVGSSIERQNSHRNWFSKIFSFPLDHRSTQRHSLTEPLIFQLSVQSELFWQKVSPPFHLTLRNVRGFTCKSNRTSYMRAQTSLFHARRAPIPIDYRLREIKAESLRIYLLSIINKLQIFARNLSTRFPVKWYFNRAAEWKIFLLRDLFWWKPEYINYAFEKLFHSV